MSSGKGKDKGKNTLHSKLRERESKLGFFKTMKAEQIPTQLFLSPTLNGYSSGNSGLAEIASRAVREFGEESESDALATNSDQEEFEFAILSGEPDASSISANEIFYNGQIRPFYPVFDNKLLVNNSLQKDEAAENFTATAKVSRPPLRKLMNEDRQMTMSSSSSSEWENLEGIPSDTYCIWYPKTEESKKIKSNESTRRWKLRNFLYNYNRSKTDQGEDTLWTPSNMKGNVLKKKIERSRSSNGIDYVAEQKGKAMKEPEMRRSYCYLSHRQGFGGFVPDVTATN